MANNDAYKSRLKELRGDDKDRVAPATDVLGEFKHKGETIRCMVSTFEGRRFFNVREWYMNNNDELKPGKNGFCFTAEKCMKLREALDKFLATSK